MDEIKEPIAEGQKGVNQKATDESKAGQEGAPVEEPKAAEAPVEEQPPIPAADE